MASLTAFLLAFSVLCGNVPVLALTGSKIAQDLTARLSAGSHVFLPSDPAYANQTTSRWEITAPPTYVVAVKPDSIVDVQKVVSGLWCEFLLFPDCWSTGWDFGETHFC